MDGSQSSISFESVKEVCDFVSEIVERCRLSIDVYESALNGFSASIYYRTEMEPWLAIDIFADSSEGITRISFSQFFHAIFFGDIEMVFSKDGHIHGLREKTTLSPIPGLNLFTLRKKFEEDSCIIIENLTRTGNFNVFFAKDSASSSLTAFECFFKTLISSCENIGNISLDRTHHMSHL